MLRGCCYILILIELLLGVAHLLWPEYRWGQGRASYFNFNNRLTIASWLASMQLVGVAILALIRFHREQLKIRPFTSRPTWIWLGGAIMALGLSVAEITRFHERFNLFGFPTPNVYEQLVIFPLWFALLLLFGWFILHKLQSNPRHRKYATGWLMAWGLQFLLAIFAHSNASLARSELVLPLIKGWAYLGGITLLLMALDGLAFYPDGQAEALFSDSRVKRIVPFAQGPGRIWIFLGVGGVAFSLIFLQIILFQILTIFGDYITAHSVIAIALLGIAIGGVVGFFTATHAPYQAIIAASILLPVSILVAFGAGVSLMDSPLLASILLTLPFICGSTVITVALARTDSHLVYGIDLLGAAAGALLVSPALSYFREESSLLFLGGFTLLIAGSFIMSYPVRRVRNMTIGLTLTGVLYFVLIGNLNLQYDWLNIVRTKILHRYPEAQVLFSKSSFVGRYDVIRRWPASGTLKAYENGRTIDTIRSRPAAHYQIDPRLPYTLISDPVILILGLSGDGITKTAKNLSSKVYGVEINPAVVDLQTNELARFNRGSYRKIQVAVMDGRSYIEQSNQQYDIITLMNAHFARGLTAARSPSPEYLHTREAMASYLRHLTPRGVLILEEVVNRPNKEPPAWKLLATMRRALIDRGVLQPQKHFFIFQWKSKTNNYLQILMKKEPFTKADLVKLRRWTREVDQIKQLEARKGRRLGPIRAKTTILYSPDEAYHTTYARILKGAVSVAFQRAHNLRATTDDRPFHFNVNPARPHLKASYRRMLLMTVPLWPFFMLFLRRFKSEARIALPYMFVVSLTGMGYLLVEVVFIQRYEIFLGSPIVTFASVLGTLLVFSGIGSLWSGRVGDKGIYAAMAATLILLIGHLLWAPALFSLGMALSLPFKVMFTVVSLAPLAFFMGVPFPYVLRMAKLKLAHSAAALLFGLNTATSALAVPLALNISTAWGLTAVLEISLLIYAAVGLALVTLRKKRFALLGIEAAALVFLLVLAVPWFAGGWGSDASIPEHPRIYGVNYGYSRFPRDQAIKGGSPRKKVSFAWFFWVIRTKNRTILVDTGFDDAETAHRWKIRNFVPPTSRLRQLGLSPNDVSDIILTHAHWDHMGNLSAYKNAAIWIQDREYRWLKRMVSAATPHARGMRLKDLKVLRRAEKEGRLKRVSGTKQLLPGIRMTLGGAHTPGSQYVSVQTLVGPVIIAGDTTYLYRNNQRHEPIGTAVDYEDNLDTIREMQRRAASPFYILPGHDPRIMRYFPKVSEGIVEIKALPG